MKTKFLKVLYISKRFIKLLFAWVLLHVCQRHLLKQEIWLIREKRDEARDNAFHFYKYLREHQETINAFYVITSDSADRKKVEKYENIIEADSIRHCVFFLAANYSIGSQPYGAYPFNLSLRELKLLKKLCNRRQKVVFLQHGIIKDKLSLDAFLYNCCNIDYFVTSSKKEYEFVKTTYKYPDHAIGCIGLARFDQLYSPHVVTDQVLVMPTWRKWLDGKSQDYFCNSDYYASYVRLLTDEALIRSLRENRYKLVFYVHYKMQPYVETFRAFENDVIVIADKDKNDVQDLLMTSKLMITDYSSVFFDFAYMNKPVIYYQFDKQQFRQGHYSEGYFSYENDGFGPCFDNLDDMRPYVLDMIDAECAQPETYSLRVDEFFDLRDNHNCERTYFAIKSLEE